jgi:Domain of unknown function (DUF4331)
MSNHFSAAMLKFPGDDPRLDFTDLFVFASPDNPEKTVLIIDVNPFIRGAQPADDVANFLEPWTKLL